MGIKFRCPNGHKLNVKSFLAGKKGICPHCGVSVRIPEGTAASVTADDHEGETEIETGGATTAVLTKAMADTVTVASTLAVPATSVAPVATPVAQAAPSAPAVVTAAPVISAHVVAAPMASIAPVAPVMAMPDTTPMTALPTVPIASAVPVAAAAPMGTPVQSGPLAPSPYAIMPAAAIDPINEAPNAVWYVRPPSGGQFGPARGDIMRKWLGEGRVSADSLVWRDGWQDWKNAALVFPSLGGAVAPAVEAPGAAVTFATPAKASASRPGRAKKRSNGMAVAAVITLGVIAVALLVVFIYVLSTMNQA